ncbi:MAG: hypothetical protein ABIG44_08995 [Planctomycetota bacterium]
MGEPLIATFWPERLVRGRSQALLTSMVNRLDVDAKFELVLKPPSKVTVEPLPATDARYPVSNARSCAT